MVFFVFWSCELFSWMFFDCLFGLKRKRVCTRGIIMRFYLLRLSLATMFCVLSGVRVACGVLKRDGGRFIAIWRWFCVVVLGRGFCWGFVVLCGVLVMFWLCVLVMFCQVSIWCSSYVLVVCSSYVLVVCSSYVLSSVYLVF
jgi:hypothetical protein